MRSLFRETGMHSGPDGSLKQSSGADDHVAILRGSSHHYLPRTRDRIGCLKTCKVPPWPLVASCWVTSGIFIPKPKVSTVGPWAEAKA